MMGIVENKGSNKIGRLQQIRVHLLMLFFAVSLVSFSQISLKWTPQELNKANTVKGVSYLNEVEKEAVIALNLARLYPKKFVEYELKGFTGGAEYGHYLKDSKYKKSLIKTMSHMRPMAALKPNKEMYENAKCFAIESGKRGQIGHKRKICEKKNYAECCSYGIRTGRDTILGLLIDHDVPSLGHRKICFESKYTKIGIGNGKHKKWGTCCVLEII